MKVGYSATVWDDARSGIGTYITEQLSWLERRDDIDLRPWEFGGRLLTRGQRPQTSGTQEGVSKTLRPLRDIWWHRHTLTSLVEREGFDLVHIPTLRRLPGRLPCAVVVTVHDLGPVRLANKYGMLRRIYHRYLLPRWLRSVDAIITPSQSTRSDLTELYQVPSTKIQVVPNGLDHELFCPADPVSSLALLQQHYPVRPPFFVYLSRIEHPAKNHVRLLEAFASCRDTFKLPHQLVLVGPRWNGYQEVERAAAPLIARGDVLFTGFVPKAHLPHFLRPATALIFPSLFEGFGLPVIEAMACGTPVACSRSSSLVEIAEGHALLFDPAQPGEIVTTLCTLARDSGLRDGLRERGLSHARRFTWARCVDETVSVWRQVLAQRLLRSP